MVRSCQLRRETYEISWLNLETFGWSCWVSASFMFQPCSNYVIVYLYYIDIYFASRLVYFYSAEAFTSFHTTFFETTFWESIWGPAPWAIGAHKFGCLPLPLPFWSGRFCFEGPKPLVLFVFCGLKLLSFFGVNIHFISYFCLGGG